MILAIDPGTLQLGFAVLDAGPKLVAAGTLKLKRNDPMHFRLLDIYDFLDELLLEHKPTTIALETAFAFKNPQVYMKLGYIRGILYLLAAQHDLEIKEFTPTHIKKSVTGTGAADKASVAHALTLLLPAYRDSIKTTNNYDTTDAIAIGVTCLMK